MALAGQTAAQMPHPPVVGSLKKPLDLGRLYRFLEAFRDLFGNRFGREVGNDAGSHAI